MTHRCLRRLCLIVAIFSSGFHGTIVQAETDEIAELRRDVQILRQAVDQQTRKIELLTQQIEALVENQAGATTDPAWQELPVRRAEPVPALEETALVETSFHEAVPTLTHEVQPGETLTSIAAKYGVTIQDLRDYNEIEDDRRLMAGRNLVVPAGEEPEGPVEEEEELSIDINQEVQ